MQIFTWLSYYYKKWIQVADKYCTANHLSFVLLFSQVIWWEDRSPIRVSQEKIRHSWKKAKFWRLLTNSDTKRIPQDEKTSCHQTWPSGSNVGVFLEQDFNILRFQEKFLWLSRDRLQNQSQNPITSRTYTYDFIQGTVYPKVCFGKENL